MAERSDTELKTSVKDNQKSGFSLLKNIAKNGINVEWIRKWLELLKLIHSMTLSGERYGAFKKLTTIGRYVCKNQCTEISILLSYYVYAW